MGPYTLIIGNKNYSSWSLRPWLLMKQADLPFDEIRIPLYCAGTKAAILKVSPSGKVPALIDGDITVWDSLAICEYLAERHPEKKLWPENPAARAEARSVSAEMHSGFAKLREHMAMNVRGRFPGTRRAPGVEQDIERIVAIWNGCRHRHRERGPFLFGNFSIADAMYAPVALRFVTYAVPLNASAQGYADTLLQLPAMQEWMASAKAETEVIPQFEP